MDFGPSTPGLSLPLQREEYGVSDIASPLTILYRGLKNRKVGACVQGILAGGTHMTTNIVRATLGRITGVSHSLSVPKP